MWGLLKMVLAIDSNSRTPPMPKTKYIENLPTALLAASTYRTKSITDLGMLAPFQEFLYPKLKLSDFLRDLHRSIAQSNLGRDSRKFFDPPASSSERGVTVVFTNPYASISQHICR
jgi:hypothetical protein